MRLETSWAAADEELLRLVNAGYGLLQSLETDYQNMLRGREPVDERAEATRARELASHWTAQIEEALRRIFPTPREAHILRRFARSVPDRGELFHIFVGEVHRVDNLVQGLDALRLIELPRYTGASQTVRLYVEDIDSFGRVRGTNPSTVVTALSNGRLELSEEQVQLAFETILDVSFHRVDWAGESNDLYTSNVVVNGARTATAFLLKGNGCKSRELTIADCGKNGDQIIRLFDSPAELFVVQYVGAVADAVVRDLASKVAAKRAEGKPAWFCVIDGQDTARVFKAYGMQLPVASVKKRTGATVRRRSK